MGTQRTIRRTFLCAAVAVLMMPIASAVHAQQAWPARPVNFIVPFAAGGTTDIVARLMARKLGQMWNQSVVVENRLGAGGNIGTAMVAKAAPDGYTLLLTSGAITINAHLYKNMGFTMKELTPVTNVASGPMVVVVHPSVPATNVQELIALAKAKPGTINFGSAGQGSQVHMAGENFADAARIEIVHVPYKGESIAYNDLLGGQIQMMVGNLAAASAYVKSGQLRALGVTSKQRSKMLPTVPTVDESGVPGFENSRLVRLLRAGRHAERHRGQALSRHGQGAGRPGDASRARGAGDGRGRQRARCLRQPDQRRAREVGEDHHTTQADG